MAWSGVDSAGGGDVDVYLHVLSAHAPFTDLDPDDPTNLYPHEYVAAAPAAGITNGTRATTFSPWADISRE